MLSFTSTFTTPLHISRAPCVQTWNSRRSRTRVGRREIIRAGSLEDSKKNARSQYDNIPDLNQQYLRELGWVEQKYGPKGAGDKRVSDEAKRSILASDGRPGVRRKSLVEDGMNGTDDGGEVEMDLSGYGALRARLLGDTVTVGVLGFCAAWGFGSQRDAVSFGLGTMTGLGYVWLLARGVDRLTTGARESGGQSGAGDGLQAARVGLLAAVVVGAAKRTEEFSVVMVVLGFLSYKVASLLPLVTGEAFESE